LLKNYSIRVPSLKYVGKSEMDQQSVHSYIRVKLRVVYKSIDYLYAETLFVITQK